MTKNSYTIVKTVEDGMTTYRVMGIETADNAAICQALTKAAKDAWQYLTTTPGTYTAAQLMTDKNIMPLSLREGVKLPEEMTTVSVECGTFKCRIGLKSMYGRDNYLPLFGLLAEFEKQARVKQNERTMFTARMNMGELVCEARIILPTDIKAICTLCGHDPWYPSMSYPALDLDRQCIVATDGVMMVAKKVTVAGIRYEGKVPDTFYLPKEVERMQGEVTVRLFEHGCAVIDWNGSVVEVGHNAYYPKWHTVWPKYRGGMTIVDSKALTKVVKNVAVGLPERGKGKTEALMLTHFPASANLSIFGYDMADRTGSQLVRDCIATDEVAWRVPVDAVRLQKVLALKPKLMWAGYAEYSELPDRLVFEDMEAQMAVMLYRYVYDELKDAMQKTDAEFAVCGGHGLYHCFDKDGWLLEQIETKYPTCNENQNSLTPNPNTVESGDSLPSVGPQPHSVATLKTTFAPGRGETKTESLTANRSTLTEIQPSSISLQPSSISPQPSFAERLRAALRARLAA